MHIIGTGDNPVLIIKKSEVPKLFTNEFWHIYNLWSFFHSKIEPPDFNWKEIDPEILTVLVSMENHFNVNFSSTSVIIKLIESVIKHLRVLIGAKK